MAPRALTGTWIGLVALSLVAYLPAIAADFVYEDFRWVGELDHALEQGQLRGRPLLMLSYWLQAGRPAWEFHAVNFGIHALCSWLALRAARCWGLSPQAGLVAAAVLLLSPAFSQAAAYASARGELVAGAAVLAAAAYPGSWTYIALGWGLLLLKDSAMPAGLLLVLCGVVTYFSRRSRALAVSLTALVIASVLGAVWSRRESLAAAFAAADPLDALSAMVRHLALVPAPWLGPTIDFDIVTASPAWVLPGLLLLPVLVVGIALPRAGLACALALLLLAPRALLSSGDLPAEHHVYAAGALAALACAWVYDAAGALDPREVPLNA